MARHIAEQPEDEALGRLAHRLEDEADATRPEFSESLHERMMESLDAETSGGQLETSHRRWTPLGTLAATTAAMVVAVVLGLIARSVLNPERPVLDPTHIAIPDPRPPEPVSLPETLVVAPTPSNKESPPSEDGLTDPTLLTSLLDVKLLESFRATSEEDATFWRYAYVDQDVKRATELFFQQLPLDLSGETP